MKLKPLSLTVAALVGLAIIVHFVRRPTPPPETDARIGQPLLSAATIENAQSLTLAENGQTVELKRQDSGDWVVASYHDFPVDFSKLSTFVSSLIDAKNERLVTRRADRMERLGFAHTQVTVTGPTDQAPVTLDLGRNAEAGGRFLRYGTEEKAYLTRLSAYLDTTARNWAQAKLIDWKAEDVATVSVSFPDGKSVTASRPDASAPFALDRLPEGKELESSRVTSLVSSLISLRFNDTTTLLDPQVIAARANTRDFTLTNFSGAKISFRLGRKPEETKIKAPGTDNQKAGPTALGTAADLVPASPTADPVNANSAGPAIAAPEQETIPAGPVYVFFDESPALSRSAQMGSKRALQIAEYTYTNLPATLDAWLKDAPKAEPAVPAPGATAKP